MTNKISLCKDKRKKRPWVVRWFGEYNSATGKKRRYSRSFRLKVDAEEFQKAKTQEFDRGCKRDRAPDVTLGDFCEEWLDVRKNDVKPATLELYCYTVQRLTLFFGKDRLLRDITPKDAVVFISKQRNMSKSRMGEKLSDWSREQFKHYSKAIFEAAVTWQHILSNPFDALKFQKPARKRWYRASVDEYHGLLEAAPNLRWQVFYALAYTSGARLSELFSLTWNDIDFERGLVLISNREKTPDLPPFDVKDHEARQIPVPLHTIDLLTRLQTEAPEGVPYILLDEKRYERIRAKWQELQETGKPWRNRYMINNVNREFKRHYKRAGIIPVGTFTVHTLRKCCAQNWADRLPMNVVQNLMGHSKAETTLEYHSQVDNYHNVKGGVKSRRVAGRNKTAALSGSFCENSVFSLLCRQ